MTKFITQAVTVTKKGTCQNCASLMMFLLIFVYKYCNHLQ